MNAVLKFLVALVALTAALNVFAAADLEVNTPGVNAIKQSMQARHAQLAGHYTSGAVGLTADGLIALRDAGAVPLAQRQAGNALGGGGDGGGRGEEEEEQGGGWGHLITPPYSRRMRTHSADNACGSSALRPS